MRSFLSLTLSLTFGLFATQGTKAETDFNIVGRRMAIILQNNHYDRAELNDDMSKVIFEDYLKMLDYNRHYFTAKDIESFSKKYRTQLDDFIMDDKCMTPAEDIYNLFRKRVSARVAQAQDLLKEDKFTFDRDESIERTRKEAAWPKDEAEAQKIWKQSIRAAVLNEILRRDQIVKKATELNKPELAKFKKTPAEKISLRYERILHAIRDVDKEDIASYFLGVVARVYDPHTDYVSARSMDRFRSAMRNSLVGIGAQLTAEDDGATKITGIVVGGPADKGGELQLNDRIIGVDPLNQGSEAMIDILFMKLDKVVDKIRGKNGTSVALKVEPASGGEIKIIVIKREKVELKEEFASAQLIEIKTEAGDPRRLGIITLPSFYGDLDNAAERCSSDVEKLLRRLISEGIQGLVIDIRGNGGGYLDEVRRMTGFFSDRGPVVQERQKPRRVDVSSSSLRRAIYRGPLVVLTDKSSASASEILAGALQDNNRAVILGDSSTFGKGTVQQHIDIGRFMPLMADPKRAGYIKPTIKKFYRITGSSTQLEGVVPDIITPSINDAIEYGERYLDHPLPHDIINKAKGFNPLDRKNLFIPQLLKKSQKRIAESKDFEYILSDSKRIKERTERNQISLNYKKRVAELEADRSREKARNIERVERFAKMAAADNKRFTIYRLTLDDLKNKELKKIDLSKDAEEFMRKAKREREELDQTPKWPNEIDPVKREGIETLTDLVDITRTARIAGLLPAE